MVVMVVARIIQCKEIILGACLSVNSAVRRACIRSARKKREIPQ